MALLKKLTIEEILEALRKNYTNEQIYTFSNYILISINPFGKTLLYEKTTAKAYYNAVGTVEPHVFAIAEQAFQNIWLNRTQTIIVTGESGSGKSVNCLAAMEYLIDRTEGNVKLKKQLAAINFILERMGNAKTKLNNNSSRFGKNIKLLFDKNKKVAGAEIQILLLEKRKEGRKITYS